MGAAQHPAGECLLSAPESFAAGARDDRERIEVLELEDPDGFLVLQAAGIFLQRLVKALEGPLQPVLLEVAEAELEHGLLRVGLELQRLLEVADRARHLPLFPKDGSEEDVGGRLRRDVQGLQQLPLGVAPPRSVRVQRPEREVRQEGVGAAPDGLLVKRLRGLDLPGFPGDDPGVDERLEVRGLDRENLPQVARRALHVAGREKRLREVEAELRVAPIGLVELLDQADSAVGVERQERELRLPQALGELVPVGLVEAGDDAVPALEEAILLLDRLHALVELRLPEVADLFGADDSPPLQRLLERDHAGVRDEEVPLQVPERFEEGLQRFAGPLDHLLERGDALQEVFIEGNLVLDLPSLLHDADAGEHEELRLTADAELFVVGVPGAADLAEHQDAAG